MIAKCAVFIEDDEGSDLMMRGFRDEYDGMIALLMHLRGMFRALGQDVQLYPLDASSEEDDQQDHEDQDEDAASDVHGTVVPRSRGS